MPNPEHADLEDQELAAFRKLYQLCFYAMGGDQLPLGDGLTEAQKTKVKRSIKNNAYRIAVGIAQYVEAVSKKSTVTYKPTRTGDDTTKQILLPVFDKHHDETIEDRIAIADNASTARTFEAPDWIDAE